MRTQKRALSAIVALFAAPSIMADTFNFRVFMNENPSTWVEASSTYTEWVNTGPHFDCAAWSPAPETVNFGQSFLQTRACSQAQERTATSREFDAFSNSYRDLGSVIQMRSVSEIESQSAIGTFQDWGPYSSTFTAWLDAGSPASYTAWAPVAANQIADFVQSRSYLQPQERTEQKRESDSVTGQIRNDGSPFTVYQQDPRSETRNITVVATPWSDTTISDLGTWSPAFSSQVANYDQTRGFTQHQSRLWTYTDGATTVHSRNEARALAGQTETRNIAVTVSGWTNSGTHENCSTWSPDTMTVNYGEAFTQTRSCDQAQTRLWSHAYQGDVLHTRSEAQTIVETESQQSIGGYQNWVATTSTFTSWVNSGSRYNYSTWSPSPTSQTSDFTQTRTFSQDQVRTEQLREVDTISGQIRNVGEPVPRSQSLTGQSESQTITATATAWGNTTTSGIGAWSPAPTNQTADFTQSRTYTQNQSRVWTYRDPANATVGTFTETQALSGQTETRTVTATAAAWSNTTTSSVTAWSPAVSSQTANFTQSRTYTQNQSRLWTYKDPSNAALGTFTETRALTGQTENQTVVATAGNWSNSGGYYSCGSWSPDPSTVNYGQSYTQTRSCNQDQVRPWNYTVGGTSVGSRNEYRTVGATDSQSATGTYQNWTTASSTTSAWSTYNTVLGSWTPSASNQTSSFTQTQSVTYQQSRTVQPRQYDSVTGSYRNVGSPTTEYQDVAGTSNTRTVTVSAGSPVDSGPHTSCGTWSPAASTVNSGTTFTQSRTCSTTMSQTYSFSIGGSWTNQYGSTATETQSATGTKPMWSWSVGNSRGWNPQPDTGAILSGSCTNYGAVNGYTRSSVYYEQTCQ